MRFKSLSKAIEYTGRELFFKGEKVHTEKWQGLEIIDSPDHAMLEKLGVYFVAPMNPTREELQAEVKPNMDWAEDHFQERVSGLPLNPGETFKNWPFYRHQEKADVHRTEKEGFTHTYMERYWPKKAWDPEDRPLNGVHKGIRYEYGDLHDVLSLLRNEPLTRQAYLPVWFPEDTGAVHGGRVPCTIGYHFIIRNNKLHITYHIRACDFFRHFRDDIYLTARLAQWMLTNLKDFEGFKDVTLGDLTFCCTSMHCFWSEKPILGASVNRQEA